MVSAAAVAAAAAASAAVKAEQAAREAREARKARDRATREAKEAREKALKLAKAAREAKKLSKVVRAIESDEDTGDEFGLPKLVPQLPAVVRARARAGSRRPPAGSGSDGGAGADQTQDPQQEQERQDEQPGERQALPRADQEAADREARRTGGHQDERQDGGEQHQEGERQHGGDAPAPEEGDGETGRRRPGAAGVGGDPFPKAARTYSRARARAAVTFALPGERPGAAGREEVGDAATRGESPAADGREEGGSATEASGPPAQQSPATRSGRRAGGGGEVRRRSARVRRKSGGAAGDRDDDGGGGAVAVPDSSTAVTGEATTERSTPATEPRPYRPLPPGVDSALPLAPQPITLLSLLLVPAQATRASPRPETDAPPPTPADEAGERGGAGEEGPGAEGRGPEPDGTRDEGRPDGGETPADGCGAGDDGLHTVGSEEGVGRNVVLGADGRELRSTRSRSGSGTVRETYFEAAVEAGRDGGKGERAGRGGD